MADYRDDSSGDYREWRQGDYSPCRCRWEDWPRQLSMTPKGWWRASSIPQSAGSTVASWPDLIGYCGALTQGTAAKQPVLAANRVGGKPAVVFDGIDDWMRVAAFSGGAITQPTTHLFVLRTPTLGLLRYYCDGAAVGARQAVTTRDTNVYGYFGGSSVPLSTIAVDTNWHAFTMIFNGTSTALSRDGTLLAAGTSGTNGLAGFTIAADLADNFASPLELTEWAICTGSPSAADLAKWTAYVLAEYGL